MNQATEQISTLKLFNEKAKKLALSGFIRSLTDKNTGIMIKYDIITGNKLEPSLGRIGASDEELDAFILTYRFFIQNNEAISFNKIAEIYNNLSINKLYKDCFQAARNELNRFLNSSNELGIKFNNKKLTNVEILDTFIYGELAHTNPEKRKKFQEWTKDETTTNLLKASLSFSLIEILNIIMYVLVLNEGAIKDLSS